MSDTIGRERERKETEFFSRGKHIHSSSSVTDLSLFRSSLAIVIDIVAVEYIGIVVVDETTHDGIQRATGRCVLERTTAPHAMGGASYATRTRHVAAGGLLLLSNDSVRRKEPQRTKQAVPIESRKP